MKQIALIVDNVRSTHNVGSLLRTCDGLGVSVVYLCGITPYPKGGQSDIRLPHIAERTHKDIHKTALGAEVYQKWLYKNDITELIEDLKQNGWTVVALEQTKRSKNINTYKPNSKTALIVGPEVTGISKSVVDLCDKALEIPMRGKKESLNVAVAAAIALYLLTA